MKNLDLTLFREIARKAPIFRIVAGKWTAYLLWLTNGKFHCVPFSKTNPLHGSCNVHSRKLGCVPFPVGIFQVILEYIKSIKSASYFPFHDCQQLSSFRFLFSSQKGACSSIICKTLPKTLRIFSCYYKLLSSSYVAGSEASAHNPHLLFKRPGELSPGGKLYLNIPVFWKSSWKGKRKGELELSNYYHH